jgi:short subunit dehydrogenase-like uncharacterized protein
MSNEKKYDVAVYGASGYTGRLVAEYMAKQYPAGSSVTWAMAGRNAEKLAQVRDEVGAPADTPIVIADAENASSIEAMVDSAKVVLTTVGPYQLYGEPLVAACAARGTDYVDLCGEPAWMRHMIDAHDAAAKASGARIVFSCGFDSIPFDLGVFFLQEKAKAEFGSACARVRCRVRGMEGKFSGGTAASFGATMAAAAQDPSIIQLLQTPFALTPGFEGPDQPSGMAPMEDEALGMWVAPFIMATINTKNVHRTNALLNHAYGIDFVYDEMVITGPGEQGEQMANALASANPMGDGDVPLPGEGPTKEEREAGNYDLLFIGENSDGQTIKAGVIGTEDPGYASTSKMITESAVCLTQEAADAPGGIQTPGAAFGMALIERLRENAGITFEVEA